MNAKTEISMLDQTAIAAVFTTPNGVDALLQRLREEAANEVPDLTTKKGRDRIASLAFKVSKAKVLVDDHGKELVAEEKKRLALIDADRKKWRDACDALRDEIRKPLDDYEAAEAARIQRHKAAIEALRDLASKGMGQPSAVISGLIAEAEAVQLGDQWQEYAAAAGKAKDETLAVLRMDMERAQKHEAEQAELARLREEAARREQEDRERRIAEEAAAKARAEAEAAAKAEREASERAEREAREAAERARIAAEQAEARAKAEAEAAKLREQDAERRRIEAEERAAREAKEAGERAERDRVAAVEAERRRAEDHARREREAQEAEDKRRAADIEHRRSINREVLADLMKNAGLSDDKAKEIMVAVNAGKIRHMRIAY